MIQASPPDGSERLIDLPKRQILAHGRDLKARGLSTARVATILNEGARCRGGRWQSRRPPGALRRAA
jgi:hypothetical protein